MNYEKDNLIRAFHSGTIDFDGLVQLIKTGYLDEYFQSDEDTPEEEEADDLIERSWRSGDQSDGFRAAND